MTRTVDRPLHVLVVDDDVDLGKLIGSHLRSWGYRFTFVPSAGSLRSTFETEAADLVLLDIHLEDGDGRTLVSELKQRRPAPAVIMVTRSHQLEIAVACMKEGAEDYVTKPIDFERLRRAVDECADLLRLRDGSRDPDPDGESFHGMLGASPAMLELFARLGKVAPTNVSALILGETGTGKELAARLLHRLSRRADGPFVPVNMAAIPPALVESTLFGHVKGAFTGAVADRPGYCSQAEGGTLFLDEIGDMPTDAQAALLRFLQDRRVEPVGGSRSAALDVRVVAATHVDPQSAIDDGRLREDLYYRLRVVSLELPPLRSRGEDVLLLARHFLAMAAARHRSVMHELSAEASACLLRYSWPGNVRQLESLVEEAVVMNDGQVLEVAMLPDELRAEPPHASAWSDAECTELAMLQDALGASEGDPERAADLLSVSRATIYRRLKKYGLKRG